VCSSDLKATALKLAEAGAVTIIVARDPEKLKAATEEAARKGLTLISYDHCPDF
jgi:NADP-dependent 3-hydroxy acid dehydrogenase YdfG